MSRRAAQRDAVLNGSLSATKRTVLAALCAVLAGCGIDEKLEGCGSRAEALAAEGLEHSTGVSVDLAGLTMPLPEGYTYRIRDRVLELFPEPGVYCDSGDWGVLQKGYVRVQLHEGAAPADPFRHFPETHRGHMREQLVHAPADPLEYPIAHNILVWQTKAYFNNEYHPRIVFMYLWTELSVSGSNTGLSIHHFPRGTEQVIAELVATIEKVTREAPQADY